MLSRVTPAALVLVALAIPGLVDAQDPPPAQPQPAPDPIDGNVVETLDEEGNFEMLIEALETAGLLETLQVDQGPLTLFAPTDEAFEQLPQEERDQILQNPAELQNLLAYHVVPAAAMGSEELAQSGQAESALGIPLEIQAAEDHVMVEGAEAADTDLDAANGVIHAVNEVLTPPEAPAPPPN